MRRRHPVARTLGAAALGCALHAAPCGAQAADAAPRLGAASERPIQVAFTAGTTGIGLEMSRLVASRVGLRVGASGLGYSTREQELYDVPALLSVRLVSARALVDLYPFRRAALRLTGGILSGTNQVLLRATPGAGTVELDGVEYPAGVVGRLDADITVPRTMPFVGVGFGRPTRAGFTFVPFADVGVALGRATVVARAENPTGDPQLAASVEAERRNLQRDIDRLPFLPVLTTAVGWRF